VEPVVTLFGRILPNVAAGLLKMMLVTDNPFVVVPLPDTGARRAAVNVYGARGEGFERADDFR
jgi:hypothetical protein